MATIDFPSSPTTGQLFTVAGTGVTYMYNGTLWLVQAGPGGGMGDFCANQTSSFPALPGSTVFATLVLTQVVAGNAGLWYSTSTGRYTPPAGRFCIYAAYSANWTGGVAHFHLKLRKNGTDLQLCSETSSGTNNFAEPSVTLIVDANGSDWFDIQGAVNQATPGSIGALVFQAFPLTGMQGPMGPPFGGGTGDFMATNSANIALTTSYQPLTLNTVLCGNASSAYSTSTGRYTPPAGRYNISVGYSGVDSVAAFQVRVGLYKNGVLVGAGSLLTLAGPGYFGCPTYEAIVDASGSDYFQIVGLSSLTTTVVQSATAWFLAYPLTGMQGPAGPAGPDSKLLQSVSFQTSAATSGTTLIPLDDTIPQITEGNEYMTLAITPRSATSKLIIEVIWFGMNDFAGQQDLTVALFQDSAANALAAVGSTGPVNATRTVPLRHTMTSGTTSATTFRVRAGGRMAGTTWFNGFGGRMYGGVAASSIVIREEAP